jgi:hypothetical protein
MIVTWLAGHLLANKWLYLPVAQLAGIILFICSRPKKADFNTRNIWLSVKVKIREQTHLKCCFFFRKSKPHCNRVDLINVLASIRWYKHGWHRKGCQSRHPWSWWKCLGHQCRVKCKYLVLFHPFHLTNTLTSIVETTRSPGINQGF